MLGLIGQKVGMTQVFDNDGHLIPVTAIKIEGNVVVAERTEAKKAKNFARCDEIRDILKSRGITIIDTPKGPEWKRG